MELDKFLQDMRDKGNSEQSEAELHEHAERLVTSELERADKKLKDELAVQMEDLLTKVRFYSRWLRLHDHMSIVYIFAF